MKSSLSRFSVILAIASLSLVGCGKSEAPATTAPAADGVRTIAITANDTMQFSVKEINATPGESLRITFANVGKMPKQAMSHNWVLLKPMNDSELNAFGMGASAKPPVYLPDDQSAVIAHTKMLGPAENDQIEFTAPLTPGTYPFICTFPGHYAIMRGTLVVK